MVDQSGGGMTKYRADAPAVRLAYRMIIINSVGRLSI